MVHEAAAQGYQQRSATYVEGRPSYHPDVLDAAVQHIDTSVGAGITIDLGAGTGISTAALIERGLDVRAVEPVEAMRTTLQEQVPDAQVVDGTAETIPFPDGSACAVVAAQAFHWFDHGPALDEIARVLADQGVLVTLWNVRDESVPWVAALTAIQDVEQGDTPRYRTMKWREAITQDHRFDQVHEMQVDNPQASNAEHTMNRVLSTSFIAKLSNERQAELAQQVRELVNDLGETYDYPYFSEVQIWRLSG